MADTYFIQIGDREYEVHIRGNETIINGKPVQLESVACDGDRIDLQHNGDVRKLILDRSGEESFLLHRGKEHSLRIETRRDRLLRLASSGSQGGIHHPEIRAAMPGLVVKILAQPGTVVKKGDSVMILEAMKMENEIRSPVDGIISEIHATEHGSVEKGDVLVVFE